jgi:hypothetical protein
VGFLLAPGTSRPATQRSRLLCKRAANYCDYKHQSLVMEDLARILIALAGFGAGAVVVWVAVISDPVAKLPREEE